MDKTGGAAFPQVGDMHVFKEGMTLLDYFAGQALQGLIASRTDRATHWHPKNDAKYCYRIAESMLAEKSKREAGE